MCANEHHHFSCGQKDPGDVGVLIKSAVRLIDHLLQFHPYVYPYPHLYAPIVG